MHDDKQESCPIFDEAQELPQPFPEHVPRVGCRHGKPGSRHPKSFYSYDSEGPQLSSAGSITHAGPNAKPRSAGAPVSQLQQRPTGGERAPRAPGTSFAPLLPADGNSGGTGAGRCGCGAGQARADPAGAARRCAASGTLLPGRAGARRSRRFLAEGKRAPGSRLLWDVGLPGTPGSLPASYCTVS